MQRNCFTGFTLINLLVTLTIGSILATTAIPSLHTLLNNNQANNAYQRLFTLIQFTRIQSVNYQSQVILCPTINRVNCISDWNRELMVFVDRNYDENRSDGEILLQIQAASTQNENLIWRASGSRRYLRFKTDGSTGNQNGRLTYCLRQGEEFYARQIIMYRTGRARRASENEIIGQC